MRQVFHVTGQQVVGAHHGVPVSQYRVAQVRTQEARAAGDQDPHRVLPIPQKSKMLRAAALHRRAIYRYRDYLRTVRTVLANGAQGNQSVVTIVAAECAFPIASEDMRVST